jgi:hypothetical protein
MADQFESKIANFHVKKSRNIAPQPDCYCDGFFLDPGYLMLVILMLT